MEGVIIQEGARLTSWPRCLAPIRGRAHMWALSQINMLIISRERFGTA